MMVFDKARCAMAGSAYLDALVLYRTQFPTLDSLGAGDPPAAWFAELNKVAPEAFDPITGTSVALDGGSVGGVLNFSQKHKVRALHQRRAEIDATYTNPYLVPANEPLPYVRAGFRVRLGY